MRSRLFLVSYAVLYQHEALGTGQAMDFLIEFSQLIHGSAKLRSVHSLGLLSCGSQGRNGFTSAVLELVLKGVLCTHRSLTRQGRKQPDV